MASYNYAESANVNLVCCICRSPFIEPCTSRTCSHTFCYDCISQAIAVNHQCPIDRTPLTLHDLLPADPVIRNLVDELTVHCPQQSLGCSHTCQRHLLPVHLKDTCQYVQLPCPHACCAQLILRKNLNQHRCPEAPSIATASPAEHPESKDSLEERKDTEVEAETHPAGLADSVGRSAPVDLAAENAMLRLRLSALENVVHTLRREMLAVKCSLGPWYRPDIQLPMETEEQAGDLEASSEAFERQLAEELALPNGVPVAENPSPPTTRDPSDIASYFPPVEENGISQISSQQRQHRSTSSAVRILVSPSPAQMSGSVSPVGVSIASVFPHIHTNAMYNPNAFTTTAQTPGTTYTQGTSFPATSAATISIPPLDPSTPLPDTLATLHASLVTTAGALGALAAARGVEALRTGEEMRGLRAAMHGLRMQVHDIITSRTHQASLPGSNGGPVGSNNANGEEQTYNVASPGWFGYGQRPYGVPPMHHHPPPFGLPGVSPINITKL